MKMKPVTLAFFLFSFAFLPLFSMENQSGTIGPEWSFNESSRFSRWEHRDMTELSFGTDAASFVSGGDSSIVSPGLSFSAEQFPICEIVMSTDKAANGELFFLTAGDGGFTQKKSLSFRIQPSIGFQTFKLDCRRNPLWNGTVTRLRFDPVSASGCQRPHPLDPHACS